MYYFLSILVDSARKARAVFLATTSAIQIINNSWGVVMHIRKYLSIFLIGLVFAIAGCSSDSSSGISDEDRLPDTDNDGIVDKHDGDIDGDGKPNQNDDDIDGDGVTNDKDGDDDGDGIADGGDSTPEGPPSVDGDSDGDGTPDKNDPTPGGDAGVACTSAEIIAPNDERFTGKYAEVSWTLLPAGCGAQSGVTGKATAEADGEIKSQNTYTESLPVNPGATHVLIRIPHKCSWDGTQEVTYSISQIGTALGDPSADTSHKYKQTIKHPVSPSHLCKKDPVIADSNIGRLRGVECEKGLNGAMTCGEGDVKGSRWQLWATNQPGPLVELSKFEKPTWSVPGFTGNMSIYLAKGADCKAAVTAAGGGSTTGGLYYYYTGPGDANWEKLADAGCKVRITLEECLEANECGGTNSKYMNSAKPGNFILNLNETKDSITINSWSAGKLN